MKKPFKILCQVPNKLKCASIWRYWAVLSILFLIYILFLPSYIKAQPAETSLDNSQELEAFLDPIFKERMENLHVPGAVIAIVKDGRIIFTKGYGIADIDKQTPVVSDKTIFRIGSITKVFTALTVRQMADRRKIKLSDDVNKYLTRVKVPNTFAKPVTFASLLTHTSGLDDISPGRHTSDKNQIIPLEEFLKTRIVRHLPPGEAINYSTYNPALAALAVEQITRTPFKVYLEKNIFEPLRMNHTSIAAVQKGYQEDLATGYEYDNGKYQKLPFQWFHTYPASDINSTATDMARFMIANLQLGTIDGQRILSEKSAREMQRTQFRMNQQIVGWTYGLYEGVQNNLRYIEHGGNMDDGFSALMTLVPGKNLGIFVAGTTENGGSQIAETIRKALFNRFYPAVIKQDAPPTQPLSPDVLKKLTGKYRSIIYCHSCPPSANAFVPEPFEVMVTDDGMLSFLNRRFRQIAPLLFVQVDGERAGQTLVGFKTNKKGEILYMFRDTRVFEKIMP